MASAGSFQLLQRLGGVVGGARAYPAGHRAAAARARGQQVANASPTMFRQYTTSVSATLLAEQIDEARAVVAGYHHELALHRSLSYLDTQPHPERHPRPVQQGLKRSRPMWSVPSG